MTYGYRLNVEDIFFRMAEEHFQKAKENMEGVPHSPPNGPSETFLAPTSSEGQASAVLAIVGWAISVESFVNQCWNKIVSPTLPTESLNKRLIRTLNTIEKVKEIIKAKNLEPSNYNWIKDIKSLFDQRNKYVHFKEDISYQGFETPPKEEFDLRADNLYVLRNAAISAIQNLGELVQELRTNFINGDFEIVHDEG